MTKSETVRAAGDLGLPVAERAVDAPGRTAQRTVTRADLAEAVYRCVGLSRKESAILVQSVLNEIARL
jgi:integration host factor subunit alpha